MISESHCVSVESGVLFWERIACLCVHSLACGYLQRVMFWTRPWSSMSTTMLCIGSNLPCISQATRVWRMVWISCCKQWVGTMNLQRSLHACRCIYAVCGLKLIFGYPSEQMCICSHHRFSPTHSHNNLFGAGLFPTIHYAFVSILSSFCFNTQVREKYNHWVICSKALLFCLRTFFSGPYAIRDFFEAAARNSSMIQGAWIFMLEADYVWMQPPIVSTATCIAYTSHMYIS